MGGFATEGVIPKVYLHICLSVAVNFPVKKSGPLSGIVNFVQGPASKDMSALGAVLSTITLTTLLEICPAGTPGTGGAPVFFNNTLI